jgi:hypothetical protein
MSGDVCDEKVTIAHKNSGNVASAPMAACLSQNNSRFKMSHLLGFVLMLDLKQHSDGKQFNTSIGTGGTSEHLESSGLKCVSRPIQPKAVNLFAIKALAQPGVCE